MKPMAVSPSLVEQVRDAVLDEIASGRWAAGSRVIQEQLAQELGVSRQPVQQALLLLREQGVLREAPGRGLEVVPLVAEQIEQVYELRAVIEGLAARRAAERGAARAAAEGPALVATGRAAVAAGDLPALVAADQAFHRFLYEISGNALIAPAMAAHWTQLQRAMAEVLVRDEQPRDIWDQHAAILAAVAAGDGDSAEARAREHLTQAAGYMLARLRSQARAAAD
jgi:DNA-binding GntR family transcriptional regulator